mmetsp:Transcript_11023/g.28287  ORF Transcript_11023/g.28287 Transcript_11023/m.28287 type:complete len:85 (+) Transcript_11023:809-1063(+)
MSKVMSKGSYKHGKLDNWVLTDILDWPCRCSQQFCSVFTFDTFDSLSRRGLLGMTSLQNRRMCHKPKKAYASPPGNWRGMPLRW